MCDCENVDIGSYDNQTLLTAPDHMPKDNGYCIDTCLVEEIKHLWSLGIITTGCCCGHNKLWGYIGVDEANEAQMIELGYQVQFNFSRPDDTDGFWPKSVEPDLNNILRFYYRRENELRKEIKRLMRGRQ